MGCRGVTGLEVWGFGALGLQGLPGFVFAVDSERRCRALDMCGPTIKARSPKSSTLWLAQRGAATQKQKA